MGSPHEAEIVACIPSLRRYARGLAHDPQRADDLVQDTLERAWGRFSMWQRRGAIRSWMFGIMHNLYIDRLRSQRNSPEEDAGEELPEAVAAPADRLGLRDLERALQRLSTEQREVLLLVGVEEMSYRGSLRRSACRSAPSCRACRERASACAPSSTTVPHRPRCSA